MYYLMEYFPHPKTSGASPPPFPWALATTVYLLQSVTWLEWYNDSLSNCLLYLVNSLKAYISYSCFELDSLFHCLAQALFSCTQPELIFFSLICDSFSFVSMCYKSLIHLFVQGCLVCVWTIVNKIVVNISCLDYFMWTEMFSLFECNCWIIW